MGGGHGRVARSEGQLASRAAWGEREVFVGLSYSRRPLKDMQIRVQPWQVLIWSQRVDRTENSRSLKVFWSIYRLVCIEICIMCDMFNLYVRKVRAVCSDTGMLKLYIDLENRPKCGAWNGSKIP